MNISCPYLSVTSLCPYLRFAHVPMPLSLFLPDPPYQRVSLYYCPLMSFIYGYLPIAFIFLFPSFLSLCSVISLSSHAGVLINSSPSLTILVSTYLLISLCPYPVYFCLATSLSPDMFHSLSLYVRLPPFLSYLLISLCTCFCTCLCG